MAKTVSKLSTKDIADPSSGSATPKTLQPSNAVIKVNSIELRKEPFEGDPYNILLNCEGEDMGESFEGFQLDKGKPELGTAKGQVGRVRATEFTFSTRMVGTKPISRDAEMLKWLKSFCKAAGILDWLDAQDNKHETVFDIYEALNTEKPFKDVWMNSTLAGKAYTNAGGFLNYDLFLPWFTVKGVPLEKVGTAPSMLIPFSAELHIKSGKKKAAPTVEDFTPGPKSRAKDAGFEL